MNENPYLQMLKVAQAQAKANGISDIPTETLDDFGLGNVECEKCHNKGYILYKRDGIDYARECECMTKRRSMRRIRNSGMEDMLERYTFDSYDVSDTRRAAVDPTRKAIKENAEEFAETNSGWFFIAGQSGSGKTHICTAICKRLIDYGKDVYYMSWRDESRKLKSLVNSDDIDEPLKRLKSVSVLYIDDFLKGGWSDADIRLAFEILNSRYNNRMLRTIISTEIPLNKLFDIDEAMAGRIYERSKGYTFKAPAENWRLR